MIPGQENTLQGGPGKKKLNEETGGFFPHGYGKDRARAWHHDRVEGAVPELEASVCAWYSKLSASPDLTEATA